ncbi:MAG: DUF922 domain-containing protein [Chloroflexota bacterium]
MSKRKKAPRRKKQQQRPEEPLSTVPPTASPPVPLARLPEHGTSRPLRQAAVTDMQHRHGNAFVQRTLAQGRLVQANAETAAVIQRQDGHRRQGANPGGRGPGRIQHAREVVYEVSGAALADITDQLNRFDGFASQTEAPLGLAGRVRPQRQPDDSFQVTVRWQINGAAVHLPRWTDYNTACPAAQQEWDRFLRQTRLHEQEAHVNAGREFVNQLGEEDTVINGATIEELQANLETKQQELGERLQAIHDACDHGVGLDAILHPDNGRCPDE